jgi:hypothetical protein
MTIASESIVTLYEVNNLTVEEIAEVESLGVVEVKQLLAQYSRVYRERLVRGNGSGSGNGKKGEEEITEAEMLEIMTSLARSSENDNVRLAAAKYVRDELKGRNDVRADNGPLDELQGLHLLNAALRKTRRINQLKAPKERVIDAELVGEVGEK